MSIHSSSNIIYMLQIILNTIINVLTITLITKIVNVFTKTLITNFINAFTNNTMKS